MRTFVTGRSGGPAPATRRLSAWARAGLLVLLVVGLTSGLWAQLAPSSFFDDFPLGRGWVAADGPYNEHLVRDFGGLHLALAIVTWGALRSARSSQAVVTALAWLAFAVPHVTYHLHHLDLYAGIDVAGNIIGTGGTAGAALLVLASAWRRPGAPVPLAVAPDRPGTPVVTAP